MTPTLRQRLHEACPICSGKWCKYTPEQHANIFCKCDGFHAILEDLPLTNPLPQDRVVDPAGEVRSAGHSRGDAIPDAPEPLPSVDTHLAQQWLNECEGLSSAKAIFHCAQAALADRKALEEKLAKACEMADIHEDAVQSLERKIAQARRETAFDIWENFNISPETRIAIRAKYFPEEP